MESSKFTNLDLHMSKLKINEILSNDDYKNYDSLFIKLDASGMKKTDIDNSIIKQWIIRRINPYKSIINSFHQTTPKIAIDLQSNVNKLLYNVLSEEIINTLDFKKEQTLVTIIYFILKNPQKVSDGDRSKFAEIWYPEFKIDENNREDSNILNKLLSNKPTFHYMEPNEHTALEIIDNIDPIVEEIKKEIDRLGKPITKDFGMRYQALLIAKNEIAYLRSSHSIVLKRQAIRMLPKIIRLLSKIHESEIAGLFLMHFNDTLVDLDDKGYLDFSKTY